MRLLILKFFPILIVAGCLCNLPLAAQENMPSRNKGAAQYDIFKSPTIGNIQIKSSRTQFTPIITGPGQTVPPDNKHPGFTNTPPEEANERLLQQHYMPAGQYNASERSRQLDEAYGDIAQNRPNEKRMQWLNKTAVYRESFDVINKLNPDNFSVTDAVYIVENAFLDNKIQYKEFINAVKLRADLVKQILKREHLSTGNNLALNYGIQQLYSQSNTYYNPSTHTTVEVPPFLYDFNDFQGEQDYTKMFTTKLLATGKGQCHSMPLLYLMIAEQLGARAWLSLAPQHSFVQFTDTNANLMNFETTNGNIVSSHWLSQSGYITANALKQRTYLDTLSQRQLYAQCLGDLLSGYIKKFGYDDLTEQIKQRILQLNPNNMIALIADAEIKKLTMLQKISAAGNPPENKLSQYPDAYQAYMAMQDAFNKIDALGYQDMPKEAYQEWLQSVEQEKKKQEYQTLKAHMNQGLKHTRIQTPVYK